MERYSEARLQRLTEARDCLEGAIARLKRDEEFESETHDLICVHTQLSHEMVAVRHVLARKNVKKEGE